MLEMFRFRCRTVRRDLWDFAGERLSEGPMEQVERHLNQCAACRQEVKVMREAQQLLSVCREATPPSRAGWSDLRHRLAAEEPQRVRLPEYRMPAPRSNWMPHVSMAAGFASLLIVSAVAYRIVMPNHRATPENPSPSFVAANEPPTYGGGLIPTPTSRFNFDGGSLRNTTGLLGNTEDTKPHPETVAKSEVKPQNEDTGSEKPLVVKNATPSAAPKKQEPKVRTVPKDIEFDLKKDRDGRLRYVGTKPQEKKSIQKKVETPMLSEADNYVPAGNGYVMGTLTPAGYEEEAY